MAFEERLGEIHRSLDIMARLGMQRLAENTVFLQMPSPERLLGHTNVLALGGDLCSIRIMEETMSDSPALIKAVFDPSEIDYSMTQVRPAASLAARFAAKEAGFKACGFRFREFIVVHEVGRNPSVRLEGSARERARMLGVGAHLLSLSHDADYAMAVYIALNLTS